MAVAVVERFKQEPMYGLSAGSKEGGRSLVEVRLYYIFSLCTRESSETFGEVILQNSCVQCLDIQFGECRFNSFGF